MTDHLNLLPADPEWTKKVLELTETARRELDCLVVVVAVQEEGKLAINAVGPESGHLAELTADMSTFFRKLAIAVEMVEAQRSAQRPN